MGGNHLVTTVTSTQYMFDAEDFLSHAQEKWPNCRVFRFDSEDRTSDASVNVRPAGGVPFNVIHYPDNQTLSTDAEDGVAADIAAWIRSLHPNPELVLWYIDDSFAGHVVLVPGITAEEILSNWVDHKEHDPYAEYPDYFK
ncbi:Hypothetical protein ACGLYG10_2858 [Actinomyces glycerinitolerans]|uniref:Uncharacterized protein n=1 Tax=Actinomyces glycerinitolerans TaxID=1892869 RepID=A0A1M4S3P1_9ACTO|nr:Hypothetical protein ACGLYG10_2858 [Actinomyces glycerinitolerans]